MTTERQQARRFCAAGSPFTARLKMPWKPRRKKEGSRHMKKIFVTGGAGGLGMAIVREHLRAGDRVWALDRHSNPRMDELLAAEPDLQFILCDISRTANVRAAVGPLVPEIGRLDLLYSCAGIFRFEEKAPLPETDLDNAASMYDVNAVGFLRVVQALLPAIGDGTGIMCVTSEAGSIGENWRSAEYSYCMSKAAENMACVLLQKHFDNAGLKTRVLCLHPGWLRTAMGGEEALKHPEASIEPEESAACLVGIARDLDSIPKDCMYMDWLRRPYRW